MSDSSVIANNTRARQARDDVRRACARLRDASCATPDEDAPYLERLAAGLDKLADETVERLAAKETV